MNVSPKHNLLKILSAEVKPANTKLCVVTNMKILTYGLYFCILMNNYVQGLDPKLLAQILIGFKDSKS